MIEVENVGKSFTLHNQGGVSIPVMAGARCGWRRASAWRWWGRRGPANRR